MTGWKDPIPVTERVNDPSVSPVRNVRRQAHRNLKSGGCDLQSPLFSFLSVNPDLPSSVCRLLDGICRKEDQNVDRQRYQSAEYTSRTVSEA